MKTINTAHGPYAKFSKEEIAALKKAYQILSDAVEIESDSDYLHPRNYIELFCSQSYLKTFLLTRNIL